MVIGGDALVQAAMAKLYGSLDCDVAIKDLHAIGQWPTVSVQKEEFVHRCSQAEQVNLFFFLNKKRLKLVPVCRLWFDATEGVTTSRTRDVKFVLFNYREREKRRKTVLVAGLN